MKPLRLTQRSSQTPRIPGPVSLCLTVAHGRSDQPVHCAAALMTDGREIFICLNRAVRVDNQQLLAGLYLSSLGLGPPFLQTFGPFPKPCLDQVLRKSMTVKRRALSGDFRQIHINVKTLVFLTPESTKEISLKILRERPLDLGEITFIG